MFSCLISDGAFFTRVTNIALGCLISNDPFSHTHKIIAGVSD
jgi:hypothetical protein